MAEFQPPDALLINNGGGSSSTGGGALGVVPSAAPETTTTKRQRKPSVRLGDIGADQSPYDIPPAPPRRSNKLPWKQPLKSSSNNNKIRPLLNLAGPHQTLAADDTANLDAVAIGSWKVRDSKNTKRSSKRVRSNWEEFDQFSGGEDDDNVDDDNNNNNNNNDNEFGDFDSESPLLNEGGGRFRRGNTREFVEGPSDTDGGRGWNERNGVRVWLNQLGLGRYAPVFEIHEVDDEVLPMLTLEDLKDMGISAVGSRRKMYSSIQKLGKGFS